MALIGYARVSTQDQHLHLQQDALTGAGCSKIYTDTMSGGAIERKGLDEALDYVRAGDTLVVWRLDRLGRSLKHLIEIVTMLHERRIVLKSLTEQIDTGTSGGKLIFHIFGALAEFERNLIQERTNAGLLAARARGKRGGRPKSPMNEEKRLAMAKKMYEDKSMPVADICKALHIPRSTFYKYVKGYSKKGCIKNLVRPIKDGSVEPFAFLQHSSRRPTKPPRGLCPRPCLPADPNLAELSSEPSSTSARPRGYG